MSVKYYLLRFVGNFFSLLSYPAIHRLGRFFGLVAFYLHFEFRKKALGNLAIAYGQTKTEKERRKIAKLSFQNLMITVLEFFRLRRSKGKLSEIAYFDVNPKVKELVDKKQGIIFLSAHQANWEVPFLIMTERMPGIAIGRPIKNSKIYDYVLSIREMNGGKIVLPKKAIWEGVRALKQGKFLGIVGDQAFPNSGYSYPLLGTRAWTAATPAILAYKTKCPIVVGCCRRIEGKYVVSGSDPIWADNSKSAKEEVPRLMDLVMSLLEKSIHEKPEEWMWVHDRWKQQGINHVKRKYRYGFILVILPAENSVALLTLLRKIYPRSFITFLTSKNSPLLFPDDEKISYEKEEDLLRRDFRFQLVLDFYGSKKARRHYKKLGAFEALFLPHDDLEYITRTLVKPECLSTVSI